MNTILKFYLLILFMLFQGCASTPEKLTYSLTFPVEYESVGYKVKYWDFGFDHIANLTIYKDKLKFFDEDINLEIPFRNIKFIKYDKPFFTDPNNYVILNLKDNKKAYFTSFKYGGWVPGTAKIYQALINAYENQ